jgi:hypothetical protein
MKTDIFGYNVGQKPNPECLPQGFILQWNAKTGKRQMWLWGLGTNLTVKEMKDIVKMVLKDLEKS